MNMQNQDTTLKSETLNLLKGLLVAVIFSIGFLVALIIKRKIEPAPIIYYEGIWIIVIMIALLIASSLLLAWLTSNSRTFASYIILGVLLGAAGSYAFHITIPTLLDRSISMFILALLDSNNLTMSEIQCNFVKQFVVESKAIEKRVKEQVATGNIYVKDGRLQITEQGKTLTSSWLGLADTFSVAKDFVEVKPDARCNSPDSDFGKIQQ